MLRPRKMKRVQMTVLKSDVNTVLEYLGRNQAMHFVEPDRERGDTAGLQESGEYIRVRALLERITACAEFLGVTLPDEPGNDSTNPGEEEEALAQRICSAIEAVKAEETGARQERQRIEEAFNEARAFSNLNAPFSDLDQLSYLTLRVGRLDPKVQAELKERLGDRAVIIPLGGEETGRVLAASSRKGRFALDTELKKYAFESIAIPEGFQGVPAELLEGLEGRLKNSELELEKIFVKKAKMAGEASQALNRLCSKILMALATERLKSHLVSTSSIYLLSGWVPSDMITQVAGDLHKITGGRTAIRIYAPDEVPEVRDGGEKVPVLLKHGTFVKGFESVVFSYGAPLYGTIDPTPLVAVFFTLLFGIMFGDLGQGFVLLLAGFMTSKFGPRIFAKFRNFSLPLIAVGIASMVMGTLTGEFFTNENVLAAPSRVITAALFGEPQDHIIAIMPLAEKGGSVKKLFYFFGFTVAIGIILNSIGLLINITNRFILKKHEEAFFSKTGIAGLLLFWYAVFIGVRFILPGPLKLNRIFWFDIPGIVVPGFFIFFGPVIWRGITREKPVLEHGLMTFIMEGLVEIMETASGYISNTVSFLRVGAFALSHAVLSYIVFRFTEEMMRSGPAGSVPALLILIFGNAVIIVLEGMIVAIQVVRLQYYEFFSKFFTDTGVEFSPFSFRNSEAKKVK